MLGQPGPGAGTLDPWGKPRRRGGIGVAGDPVLAQTILDAMRFTS
ncbi:MAG: hypothetical protein ACLPVF_09080 [Acidimicrobiales bacterium]